MIFCIETKLLGGGKRKLSFFERSTFCPGCSEKISFEYSHKIGFFLTIFYIYFKNWKKLFSWIYIFFWKDISITKNTRLNWLLFLYFVFFIINLQKFLIFQNTPFLCLKSAAFFYNLSYLTNIRMTSATFLSIPCFCCHCSSQFLY